MLVKIADWESAGARLPHIQKDAAIGLYALVSDQVAAPFRVEVIKKSS